MLLLDSHQHLTPHRDQGQVGEAMVGMKQYDLEDPSLLVSRLAYHLRYLCEDATAPAMSTLERPAVVRDRTARIRDIRWELEATKLEDL